MISVQSLRIFGLYVMYTDPSGPSKLTALGAVGVPDGRLSVWAITLEWNVL